MSLEINYNPSGGENCFYVSVYNNERENIAIVFTPEESRIMRHVYLCKGNPPTETIEGKKYSFEVISFFDSVFIEKYQAKVINLGDRLWFNRELWEIRDPIPLSKKLARELLKYVHYISDNIENLDKHLEVFDEFNRIILKELKNYIQIQHTDLNYSDLIFSAI
jgi:hypothetical protein